MSSIDFDRIAETISPDQFRPRSRSEAERGELAGRADKTKVRTRNRCSGRPRPSRRADHGAAHLVKKMEQDGVNADEAVEAMKEDPSYSPLFGARRREDQDLQKMTSAAKREFIEREGLEAYLDLLHRSYCCDDR